MNPFQDLGEPTPWTQHASCATTNPDAFFPEGHDPYPTTVKNICRGCPVVADCLTYALKHRIQEGLWGGLTPQQRERLRAAA